MYEMSDSNVDQVAGGFSISGFWTAIGAFSTAFNAWDSTMRGVGGTLNNYYGPETTLEIINGGNLGA